MNAQSSSIVKQTTINRIPLPDLVLAEIKDYLFYDRQTTNARNQKIKVVMLIKRSLTSEKIYEHLVANYKRMVNPNTTFILEEGQMFYTGTFENYLDYMDFNLNTFSFNIQYKIKRKQHSVALQQDFCRRCGDYQFREMFYGNICSENCICKCNNNM